ncbi:MAG: hypothetical protein NT136_04080 [Candidatus Moranbacteria bacterium]|nr:hypothetical protein [Candidatus Moranbacteria bacterium]
MKINFDFKWNEKVSSGLCFILICLLSLITAWYVVKAGESIIENPPQAIVKNITE